MGTQYVVLVGGLVSGFAVVGVFYDEDTAQQWVDARNTRTGDIAIVMPVRDPEEA